jgi:hypothetical protein
MPFSKADPNINRKGRGGGKGKIAATFADLRKLANTIGAEMAYTPDGDQVIINGHPVNNIERLLYEWVRSHDGKKQLAFVEIAYGKIPSNVTGEGDNKVVLNVVYGAGGPPAPQPLPEPEEEVESTDPNEHKDSGLDVEYPEGEDLLIDDDEDDEIEVVVEE